MKLIEKLAQEVCEESGWDPGEYQGFLKGFCRAREMASAYLGPPWPYAIMNTTTGKFTWDRDGMLLIQADIKSIGEEEVSGWN